jgi:hypothetical protein
MILMFMKSLSYIWDIVDNRRVIHILQEKMVYV